MYHKHGKFLIQHDDVAMVLDGLDVAHGVDDEVAFGEQDRVGWEGVGAGVRLKDRPPCCGFRYATKN